MVARNDIMKNINWQIATVNEGVVKNAIVDR
jgi:hypothetical protein